MKTLWSRNIEQDRKMQMSAERSLAISVRLRTRTIGGMLLAIFLSFYCSNHLFWHTHDTGDSKIVHSHPFSNSSHSHTAPQILTIGVLGDSALDNQESNLSWSTNLYESTVTHYVALSTLGIYQFSGDARLLRGPPTKSILSI